MSSSLLCFSTVLLTGIFAMAQQPAAPPGGQAGAGAGNAGTVGGATGAGGQGGNQGNPRSTMPTYPGQEQQRRDPYSTPDRQQMMMFLQGKVIMEDGTAPPDLVLIERVCNGSPKPEGYTDSKGRFSFQLGQNNTMLADASNSGNDPVFGNPGIGGGRNTGGFGGGGMQNRLMGCELRATLPGFRSEAVDLSQRRYMDNPDVGTIILHRLAKVEGFTFSATTAFAPKDARKAYEKGKEAVKKQKWADAERELRKAVDAYPKFAMAWNELGSVYQAQSKVDDAKVAYGESIKADAKLVTPYPQLMRIAASEKKWEEAAEYGGKAIKLNPYLSPDVYFLSGVAHYQSKKMDTAEEHARQAIKLDEKHRNPKSTYLLGVILAEKNDLPGAAEAMRNYLKYSPDAQDAAQVKQQLASIEQSLGSKEGAQAAQ